MQPANTAITQQPFNATGFQSYLNQASFTFGPIHIIFSMLNTKELMKAELVCKAWRATASSHTLWKPLYETRFGMRLQAPKESIPPWKSWYKSMHRLTRVPVIGDVTDPNMPAEVRPYFAKDLQQVASKLQILAASGTYYLLAKAQGVRELRQMTQSLDTLYCPTPTNCEEWLNNCMLYRIVVAKAKDIYTQVVVVRENAIQSRNHLNPQVIASRVLMLFSCQMPASHDELIESMQRLTLSSPPKMLELDLWKEIRQMLSENEQMRPVLQRIVGTVKDAAVSGKISISATVLIEKKRKASSIDHTVKFRFFHDTQIQAECTISYDEQAKPKLMHATCFLHPNSRVTLDHVKQLAFEVAEREKVEALQLSHGAQKSIYETFEKTFPPFLDEPGRVLPTPRRLWLRNRR